MIAIVDYGMGNLRSVQKALERVGATAQVTHDPAVVQQAEKIVLPGVGAIAPAIDKLRELGLVEVIKNNIVDGKPFLGICVGFQLLFETSTEGGHIEVLGIVKGVVQRFEQLKVPHMGWNQLKSNPGSAPMFNGVDDGTDVYFCHSYYATGVEDDVVAAQTEYGVSFVSAIKQDNVWGVQFHPEKSQQVGLQVLRNFVETTV